MDPTRGNSGRRRNRARRSAATVVTTTRNVPVKAPQQVWQRVERSVVVPQRAPRRRRQRVRNATCSGSSIPGTATITATIKALTGTGEPSACVIPLTWFFTDEGTAPSTSRLDATNGPYRYDINGQATETGCTYTGVEVLHRGATSSVGVTYSLTLLDLDTNAPLVVEDPLTSATEATAVTMAANARSRTSPQKFAGAKRHFFNFDVSNDREHELHGMVLICETFGVGAAGQASEKLVIRLYHRPPNTQF